MADSGKFEIGDPLDFTRADCDEHDEEVYLVVCVRCQIGVLICGECLRTKGIRCPCYSE